MSDIYDAIVIGGGVNGTGLVRDLTRRGFRVALFEKGDFARGATGNSSGMIHGGARYLLNDTGTTKHSCVDSGYVQNIAKHLLFRIPFLVPVLRENSFGPLGPLLYDVYFKCYDRYAAAKRGIPHARLKVDEMLALEPGLKGDFIGGVTTDEFGIDTARLCLLNALDAEAQGAEIYTYATVTGFKRDNSGAISGVTVQHARGGVKDYQAKTVINCAGAWAEALAGSVGGGFRIRPGKGVHLVFDRRLTHFSVVTDAVDGRQVFIMPYMNETWIGTTDDDFYGDLDNMQATHDEVEYLLTAIERIIPSIRAQRMIGIRIGVRNTIHAWGPSEDDLSRSYEVVDHQGLGAKNLFSVIGGKLASFRQQAEDAADAVSKHLGRVSQCDTHLHALPGADGDVDPEELCRAYPQISPLAARRLIGRHGTLAWKVLELGKETPSGFEVIEPYEPVLECELRWVIRNEHVHHLRDLSARVRLGMGADLGLQSVRRAGRIYASERGLSVPDERAEVARFIQERWSTLPPTLGKMQNLQAQFNRQHWTRWLGQEALGGF